MKKTQILLAVVLAVLSVFIGCEKKATTQTEPEDRGTMISCSPSLVNIGLDGGRVDVTLISRSEWSATTNQSWVSISPTTGQGDAFVKITVRSGEASTASVLFSNGAGTAVLKIGRGIDVIGDDNNGGDNGGVSNNKSALFSVSSTQKVYFSPGNLQYQASTKTWRFAEHQWDVVGMGYDQTNTDNYCYIGGTVQNSDNRQIGSSYSGWIDLFGWGTGDNPAKSSTNDSDYSTFTDWGVNPISNGGNKANKWRTLTKDEWVYLFTTRSNASSKYGAAKVNGMTGVVVLPDEWTLPSGCGFTAEMTSASDWYDWSLVASTNVYTSVQWEQMEANGAVFLPASGYRYEASVYDAGTYGNYWSSTPSGSSDAYDMNFRSYYLYLGSYDDRYNGFAVRLVSDI
ncbi:MAG: hypothetical protein K5660_03095 [Paludibacteraceae bacterium]|nr:hypothetical protein [Paludibacteraceae bacterium]